MRRARKVRFHEYRYQILPTSQDVQMDFEGRVSTIDDLRAKKNELFAGALSGIKSFRYPRGEVRHKPHLMSDPYFILEIGVERDLKRKTRDFEVEEVENWPTVYVAFNNSPDVQKCLVQQQGGFQRTATVVKLIEESLNAVLEKLQLAVAFEPIYAESYFWDMVGQYKGRITQIEFELISPNMSNISGSLNIDLGTLHRTTNTQRTNLKLNSDKNSTLTPSAEDPMLEGLVKYSSEGGGDISVRVRGLSRKVHTAKGVNEVTIDEAIIEGGSADQIAGVFKELLK